MNATDLCYTPATRLAAMIRAKEISPVELTRAVLERIERVNPKVNAFCVVLAEQALTSAREAEGAVMKGGALPPLLGIPFSIKDLAMTKGVKTTGGSHIYADRVPDHDAPFVRRLKAAGGVFLGKTTTPEEFVRIWQSSRSAAIAAKRLGMKRSAASVRASNYRKKGVNLKRFAAGRSLNVDASALNKLVRGIQTEK